MPGKPEPSPQHATERKWFVEHPLVIFGLALVGLALTYLGVAVAANWPPFSRNDIPAFEHSFSLTQGVQAAEAVNEMIGFLDRHHTKVVFLKLSLQEDVADIRPAPGDQPIRSIRFKPDCELARGSGLNPDPNWRSCHRFRLDFVRSPGDFDLGTARWITVASAHVEGYFLVGTNRSVMGFNRIQVSPVPAPE